MLPPTTLTPKLVPVAKETPPGEVFPRKLLSEVSGDGECRYVPEGGVEGVGGGVNGAEGEEVTKGAVSLLLPPITPMVADLLMPRVLPLGEVEAAAGVA